MRQLSASGVAQKSPVLPLGGAEEPGSLRKARACRRHSIDAALELWKVAGLCGGLWQPRGLIGE